MDTHKRVRTVLKVKKVAILATVALALTSACSGGGFNLGGYAQSKGAQVESSGEGYEYVGFGQEGDLQTVTSTVSSELSELGVGWLREPQCSANECLREGKINEEVLVLAVNKPSEGSNSVVTVTVISQ